MKTKTRDMAICGILLAASVVLLYFSSMIPSLDLTFMSLTGALVFLVSAQMGDGWGWLFFAGSTLLALLVAPGKIMLAPFFICFGPYGVLKHMIETRVGRRRLKSMKLWNGAQDGREEDGHASERKRTRTGGGSPLLLALEYGVKLVVAGGLAAGGWLIFKNAFFASADFGKYAPLIYLGGGVLVFFMYDRLLTLIVRVYVIKLLPRLRR